MLMLLVLYSWIIILLVIIGIFKNKDRRYLKQTFFSLIILSIFATLIILREGMYAYFDISIFVGVLSLLGYLFSDVEKKEKNMIKKSNMKYDSFY